jgi:hypothetical protein
LSGTSNAAVTDSAPMATTAVALADALDVPLDALFETTRSPSPQAVAGLDRVTTPVTTSGP